MQSVSRLMGRLEVRLGVRQGCRIAYNGEPMRAPAGVLVADRVPLVGDRSRLWLAPAVVARISAFMAEVGQ